MRLATLKTPHGPRPAVLIGDRFVDLVAVDNRFPSSVRSILAEPRLMSAASEIAATLGANGIPVSSAKLHAPVHDPQKIICVGLNYRDHAVESKMPIPKEPVLFSKFPSALIGHDEPIVVPKVSTKVDYEAELVVVVGKRG